MQKAIRVPIGNEGDLVTARLTGRELAEAAGFSAPETTLITTSISEIARNILSYAGSGELLLAMLDDEGGRVGIEVVASDMGPGIPDVALAMRDGYTTGQSLGLGLPGARRMMDEFDIESTPGKGTRVVMRKWILVG